MSSIPPLSASPQSTDGEPAVTRFCTRCRRELPIDAFHRTRRSGQARQVWCKGCFKTYLRLYKHTRRSARLRRYVGWLANDDIGKIRHLAVTMFKRFGGVNGLASSWIQELNAAEARGNFAFVGKTMLAVLNLAVFCETYHEQEAGPGSLTKSELAEARDIMLQDLVRSEPALVLQAAAALGWTVSPPAADSRTE